MLRNQNTQLLSQTRLMKLVAEVSFVALLATAGTAFAHGGSDGHDQPPASENTPGNMAIPGQDSAPKLSPPAKADDTLIVGGKTRGKPGLTSSRNNVNAITVYRNSTGGMDFVQPGDGPRMPEALRKLELASQISNGSHQTK